MELVFLGPIIIMLLDILYICDKAISKVKLWIAYLLEHSSHLLLSVLWFLLYLIIS